MNVYGELTKAQLENLTADPTLSTARKGRIWYRTDLTAAFVDTGGTAQRFPWELFSRTANPAASGIVRFAKTDTLAWRNNANGADLPLGIDGSDNLSYNSHAFLSSAGVVPIAAGGTNITSYAQGDILYASAANVLSKLTLGSANQLLRVNAGATAPEWATVTATYTVPTVQRFTVTGATAGYMFTVTAANATAGATYTNNGQTFTVLGTIAGGTTLFTSSTGAPAASGTLTKATGTGDATITFSANTAGGIYTTPANVLYLRVKMIGGGGGGAGSTANDGTAGGTSWFAATPVVSCTGGGGGLNTGGSGGSGGSASISGVTATIVSIAGGSGAGGQNNGSNTINLSGGNGGNGYFGGGGGVTGGGAGNAAAANTGAGGAGGSQGSNKTGGGGGAGAYAEFLISTPQAKYFYIVGTAGSGGAAGSQAGGNGAAGVLIVEEYYQ
jgi:hypothetical protein